MRGAGGSELGNEIMSKVLTVRQPYALMLVSGQKHHEFRSWSLPIWHRQSTILIHAAAKDADSIIGCSSVEFEDNLKLAKEDNLYNAIIGEVIFGEPRKMKDGRYAWPVLKAEKYKEPIRNVKGKLSIWNFEQQSNQ